MMYLPYKADQEANARELMVDMFELVLPEHVAAEVVKKDVKLIYDPDTHELVENRIPFFPGGPTSRCPRATRRINIGRARLQRRTTTTSSWTCSPGRRPSSR